jgi:predicted nuclease with TOPRIM domain
MKKARHMANDTADIQKTVEEVQQELDALVKTHERLNTAHNKLKDDHRELKASTTDATALQSQLEKLTNDKSKILREKDELQTAFDAHKKEVQVKEMKTQLTAALGEASARNPSTALKLIDLTTLKFDEDGQVQAASLAAAIEAIKVSDPELFKDGSEAVAPKTPSIKPAIDRITQSAYEVEVAAAVKKGSQKELEEVIAKYQRV